MTLTEALKEGPLVRRESWPKYYNNLAHDKTKIWVVLERPALNRWETKIPYEDAIADDWVVIEDTP
jgi:hypothetical protein